MSALDLFAMLNAPLSGTGAGASMSGQRDGQESGAFAGLLAMLSPKAGGEGAAETAPTSASAGLSLAPFRLNGAGAFVPSDDVSTDGPENETGDDAGEDAGADAEDMVQAGLMAPTPAPSPQAAAAPSVGGASSAPVPASLSPSTSSDADPAATPAASPDAEPLPTSGQPRAVASESTDANAGFQLPAAQGDRTIQASQTAQTVQTTQTAPASQSAAVPDPSGTAATPDAPPETAQSTAAADARVATEAARAAGQQTAATVVGPEAGRLAQPPRPDPAQSERRGERRDGEGRATLFATTESGDVSRPSVAAPNQTNAAVAAAPPPAPRPDGGPGEIRAEPAPVAVDPATPEGEAAPEPARPADTQGAASVREHLPSALSRASAETTAMLSAQIVRRLEARSTRFDMVLTPEDLGRVDVRMEVDSDGQLTARLAFDNPAAAAELRGRADELRRQLEAAGFQMSDSALEFAERDGGRRDQPFDQRGRAFAGAGQLADAADTLSAPPRWTALSLTPEGVDMKV